MTTGPAGSADTTGAAGRLILAATPIGDPADAPPRLQRLLAEADLIAAEDTRRLRRLTTALGVIPVGRIVSFHDHNEATRSADLVAAVAAGRTVLLVTDAGMPSVSDPGLRAVRAVVDAGLAVTAVPGPSAVLTALALSGLATDRFCFEGFVPRRAGERASALAGLTDEPRTMVFFEAPHRLTATLTAMARAFGADRPAAVCRELTKTYEQVRRGGLGELAAWAGEQPVRGEITLVVGGCSGPSVPADSAALPALVLARVDGGERLKDAARAVAAEYGVPGRELYAAAVQARRAGVSPGPDEPRTR